MAMNSDAVLLAAKGYIFTAPVGTPAPDYTEIESFTDGSSLTGWDNVGHTSRDELPVFGFDGGDTETLGSWQTSALKTVVTETPVDYVTFNLLQFDEAALELYYGVENSSTETGVFSVDDASVEATERALLIVLVDGDLKIAFHAARTAIRREAEMELAVDALAMLPLRATFLKYEGEPLFSWINGDLYNQGS